MYSKPVVLVSCILTSLLNTSVSNVPVSISGTCYMVSLNEKPYFKMNITNPNAWAYLYVKVYENDTLLSENKVLAKALSNQTFYLTPLTVKNTKTKVKIVTNYYNNDGIDDTVVEFYYKSPSYASRTVSQNTRTKSSNPVSIDFVGYGSSYQITNNYEYFTFNMPESVSMDGRYTLFNDVNYVVESSYTGTPSYAYLKIDCRFAESGFSYQKKQSVIKIEATKKNNVYTLNNDYEYYIDKKTGGIKNNQTSTTESDALPFFIPLSIGFDKTILAEYQVKNVNLNQESYTAYTSINLGNQSFDESFIDIFSNPFYYYRYENYLTGVNYNA